MRDDVDDLLCECARLKAEYERLKTSDDTIALQEYIRARLAYEERLRNHADKVAQLIESESSSDPLASTHA